MTKIIISLNLSLVLRERFLSTNLKTQECVVLYASWLHPRRASSYCPTVPTRTPHPPAPIAHSMIRIARVELFLGHRRVIVLPGSRVATHMVSKVSGLKGVRKKLV